MQYFLFCGNLSEIWIDVNREAVMNLLAQTQTTEGLAGILESAPTDAIMVMFVVFIVFSDPVVDHHHLLCDPHDSVHSHRLHPFKVD